LGSRDESELVEGLLQGGVETRVAEVLLMCC